MDSPLDEIKSFEKPYTSNATASAILCLAGLVVGAVIVPVIIGVSVGTANSKLKYQLQGTVLDK